VQNCAALNPSVKATATAVWAGRVIGNLSASLAGNTAFGGMVGQPVCGRGARRLVLRGCGVHL
jgi:hypothetical protein